MTVGTGATHWTFTPILVQRREWSLEVCHLGCHDNSDIHETMSSLRTPWMCLDMGETSMATSSESPFWPLLHHFYTLVGAQGSGLFSVYTLLFRPLAFCISLLTFVGFQTCIHPTVSSAYAVGCGGLVLKRSQIEHVYK